jgi:hypothetical protein
LLKTPTLIEKWYKNHHKRLDFGPALEKNAIRIKQKLSKFDTLTKEVYIASIRREP